MKYIITIFFTAFVCQAQAQSLHELLKDFDNLNALTHSEFYYDPGENTHSSGFHYDGLNRIKIVNVDNNWLNKITIEIKNNPKELFSYMSTNDYDYAAYTLFVNIYDLKKQLIEYHILDMVKSMVKDPSLYPEIRKGEDNITLMKGFMSTLKKSDSNMIIWLEGELKARKIL